MQSNVEKHKRREAMSLMRIDREGLLKSLEYVTPGLATKAIVEQSTCFIFRDGKVATFNDEVACVADCPLDIEGAVPADKMLAVLRKLTDDELNIELKDGQVKIKGKHARMASIRMEKEITLELDAVEQPEKWRPLAEDFNEAVRVVQSCASHDASRFRLTCIHIHPDYLEACDDFQLARYPLETGLKKSMLIKRDSLKWLTGLDPTEMSATKNWMHFRNPAGLVLSCRRYVEEYHDVDDFLDVEGTKTVLPKGIEEAVDLATVFSSDNADTNLLLIRIKSGRMRIEGHGKSGSYREDKKVNYDGPSMEFYIAPDLFLTISKRAAECIIGEGKLKVVTGKFEYVTPTTVVKEEE